MLNNKYTNITVYPGNAADFEQRYDDDVESAGIPVKQCHDVQSCLQYITTHTTPICPPVSTIL